MKENFPRKKDLDSFAIDIDDLEKLCVKLRKEFGDDDVSTSITFNLPRKKLEFDSVNEIKENLPNCKRVSDFSISFSPRPSSLYAKSLWIASSDSFGPFFIRATANSSSDSEAWSTGICETAAACLQEHKTWYRWIIQGAVWWPCITILCFSILWLYLSNLWPFALWLSSMEWVDLTHLENSNLFLLRLTSLLPCIPLFAALLYIRSWLFPYGVVLIKQKSYNARNILAILASIGTIIYTFIKIIQEFIDMLS